MNLYKHFRRFDSQSIDLCIRLFGRGSTIASLVAVLGCCYLPASQYVG